jgi:hypothetical protein
MGVNVHKDVSSEQNCAAKYQGAGKLSIHDSLGPAPS